MRETVGERSVRKALRPTYGVKFAVLLLSATIPLAGSFQSNDDSATLTSGYYYLRSEAAGGPTGDLSPSRSFLESAASTNSTAAFLDAPPLDRSVYREVGFWSMTAATEPAQLTGLGDLQIWFGLADIGDWGAYFNLRAEVLKNKQVIAFGEIVNLISVHSDPEQARKVELGFSHIEDGEFVPGDVLAFRLLARVADKGRISAASGLRLYYDSGNRPARFGAEFSPHQVRPTADAGQNLHALTSIPVRLDGSNSYDAEGKLITFRWSVVARPDGSNADLSDATAPNPWLDPDVEGNYTFELVVSNGRRDSFPSRVTVSAHPIIAPPNVRIVGEDGLVGMPVTLDGSRSYDPGSMPLDFFWSFVATPQGSWLEDDSIFFRTTASPEFVPDAAGAYILSLVAGNGAAASEDTVRVFVGESNVTPVADAGADLSRRGTLPVYLDGTGSFDPDGFPSSLEFEWSLVARPPGSTLTSSDIQVADTATPSFTPDASGTYIFALWVDDGELGHRDNVLVEILPNRSPSALDDFAATTLDTPIAIDVLANDFDPDGDPLAVTGITRGTGGSVTFAGGVVTYTPDPGFAGSDTFQYTIGDGFGGSASAAVRVAVEFVSEGPALDPGPERTRTSTESIDKTVAAPESGILSFSSHDVETSSITFTFPELVTQFLDPNQLIHFDGTLFFQGRTSSFDRELWRSDGTAAGTVRVKDIRPGDQGSSPQNLTVANGTLYFTANDGVHGRELWKSDGTEAGTVLVKDIRTDFDGASSNPGNLTDVNGTLFFTASDGIHGEELWKSDGTEAGTVLVKDIYPGPSLISGPRHLTSVNGTLFFVAAHRSSSTTVDRELWRSDGTPEGTWMVRDIIEGPNGSQPTNLTDVNGTLFFNGFDGSTGDDVHGAELWKSDGTEAGTVLVKDIRPGNLGSGPSALTNVNGTLFFTANDGVHGRELWKSDGTAAGTVLVKDFFPGDSTLIAPQNLTDVNGTLFLSANDGVHGEELWKSDGTEAGTVLVKDIRPGTPTSGSDSRFFKNFKGVLFFSANGDSNNTTNQEPWRSDGTEEGTVRLRDIFPGSNGSHPHEFTAVNDTLFFVANDLNGKHLFKLMCEGSCDPPDPPDPPDPDPLPGLRVRCTHSPIFAPLGTPVTIRAEAVRANILDITTTPADADEIQIFVTDRVVPKAVANNAGLAFYETDPFELSSAFMMSYACSVRVGETTVFSGWRTTSRFDNEGAVPVIYTGPTKERIDILFIPDEGSYNGPRDPNFLTDVESMIRDGYYDYPIFGGLGVGLIGDRFNFWIASHTGAVDGPVEDDPNDNTNCVLTKPDKWRKKYKFADAGAIIHTDRLRDCAQDGLFSTEPDSLGTLRHETGHQPFGLADEYCGETFTDDNGNTVTLPCDGGYYQKRTFPNVYRTQRNCENDAPDLGRTPADCRSFTDTRGDTYWISEPPAASDGSDLFQTHDLMVDRGKPQGADVRRIFWMYNRCAEGKC